MQKLKFVLLVSFIILPMTGKAANWLLFNGMIGFEDNGTNSTFQYTYEGHYYHPAGRFLLGASYVSDNYSSDATTITYSGFGPSLGLRGSKWFLTGSYLFNAEVTNEFSSGASSTSYLGNGWQVEAGYKLADKGGNSSIIVALTYRSFHFTEIPGSTASIDISFGATQPYIGYLITF